MAKKFYDLGNGRIINLSLVEEIKKVYRIIPSTNIFRDNEKKIWGIVINYIDGQYSEIFPECASENDIDKIINNILNYDS